MCGRFTAGLEPSWVPDPSIGSQMINARAETLLKKPSFRNLGSQRRCLIPADASMSGETMARYLDHARAATVTLESC
jgi:putative SOS response-associated peptidase YedK